LKAKKLFFIGVAIAIVAAFFDLLSKKIIFSILENIAIEQQTDNPQIEVFSFFNLAYVWNRGVSFGMFNQLENSQIIFSVIQSLIFLAVAFWLYRNEKPHVAYALGLVMGGALGNVIDRVQNGAVADFLDFHIANYHWPAFNLADSWVFIGVMILIFDDLIFKKK
jgi:signal peptidase II